jgi:hypothetical protein
MVFKATSLCCAANASAQYIAKWEPRLSIPPSLRAGDLSVKNFW